MKYAFANYPTGTHILKIGNDALKIIDGLAEVNELDPAQVTLAEVYGGKPLQISHKKQERLPAVHQSANYFFVSLLSKKGRALTAAIRNLNTHLRSVRPGSGPK